LANVWGHVHGGATLRRLDQVAYEASALPLDTASSASLVLS
jgi:acyl-CoA hydrolase